MRVRGYTLDTMAAHHAIAPDEPHDLEHIVFTYADAEPWKPPNKDHEFETFEELADYNARDVIGTSEAMGALLREMQVEGVKDVHDLDIAMFHVAVHMEQAGLPIDVEKKEQIETYAAERVEETTKTMREAVGDEEFNPNSTPQLQWALYDPSGPIGLIPNRRTEKTGKGATDKAALVSLKRQVTDERAKAFVDALVDYRLWRNMKNTYLKPITTDVAGRWHLTWKPLGARTGRWSSGSGLMSWGKHEEFDADGNPTGKVNLRKIVRVHDPSERALVGADLAQAELRVLGALSGDENLINKCIYADEERKLEPDHDPHSFVASFAFPGYAEASKDKRKILRDLVKRCIYGMMYGAGVETVLQAIYDGGYQGPDITLEMVQRTMEGVFKAFPKVREYQNKVIREAKKTGRVQDAILGRRREFPLVGFLSDAVEPSVALNYAIQCSTSSMIAMSLWEIYNELPQLDPSAHIILQVHDSIVLETSRARADECAKLLEACMAQEIQLVEGAPFMPFPATAEVGESWDQVG